MPKLTDWINAEIVFWHTDLGSNILAQNAPRGTNTKKSFAVSTLESRPDVGRGNRNFFTGTIQIIIGLI